MQNQLIVLSRPDCVQCNMTYRGLAKKKIPYRSLDMSNEADLAEGGQILRAEAHKLGYLQAPIILVKNADGETLAHWSGFRPDKLEEYKSSLLPALAA